MKTAFLLLCLLGQTCLAQDLSPGERTVLDYAAKSVTRAKSIMIVYQKQKDQQAVIEFSDKEWQLKFAELLSHSDAKWNRIHLFGFNFPLVCVKESKLAIEFPPKEAITVEVDGKSKFYVVDARQRELLLELINKKCGNQARLPTAMPATTAAGALAAPDKGVAHL